MYSNEWTDRQRPVTTATLPLHCRYTNSLARPAGSARPPALRVYSQGFRLRYCAPV